MTFWTTQAKAAEAFEVDKKLSPRLLQRRLRSTDNAGVFRAFEKAPPLKNNVAAIYHHAHPPRVLGIVVLCQRAMSACVQLANPDVEYDCDVYLYIRPLSFSECSGSAPGCLSSSSSSVLSSSTEEDRQIIDLDFLKHWQAVFLFKNSASPTETTDNGVVMIEAGKNSGYLEGEGFLTSHEVLDMENPRKVFLRSTRISLKTLTNAMSTMNGSRFPYCFVWNNCQEWITGLMRHLDVVVGRTRFSRVANVAIAMVSFGLFAYVVYLSYSAASSYRWERSVSAQLVAPSASVV
ncbi:uncharacterized protein LOC142768233 [Rhipicephalus microplus]|uniref:uncharacterized protein LOC142768233 n=1 Tax=Rhipicephalus microplus TaxID=6941 RepID=UPI003F6B034D